MTYEPKPWVVMVYTAKSEYRAQSYEQYFADREQAFADYHHLQTPNNIKAKLGDCIILTNVSQSEFLSTTKGP